MPIYHARKEHWMTFYGSSSESVVLTSSPEPDGPWERMTHLNPIRKLIENHVVTRLEDGRYIVLFDGYGENRKIGYMVYAGLQVQGVIRKSLL